MTTTSVLQGVLARHTNTLYAVLLTIEHDDLPATVRLTNARENIVSNGNTYAATAFDWLEPDEGEDAGRGRLRIENISRAIVVALEALPYVPKPTVTVDLIERDEPDTPQRPFPPFQSATYAVDAFSIEIELGWENDDDEPSCAIRYTPNVAAGLFL